MELPYAENFKIKMVEPITISTKEQRLQWIKEAKYNLFSLKSDQVYIDLLTDSGTNAMSDRQWAAVMMGDEAYAGSSSYFNMKNAIKDILGFDHFLPTHQGRAAENVLFSVLVKDGNFVPGNSPFDTTKGHIEFRKAQAVDCTVAIASATELVAPFKGNIDVEKFEKFLSENHEKVPFCLITVTNNSAGGQPVSMENIKAVRSICNKYKKMILFDSARFAENAYFIKMREKGYENKTIREIVKEMYENADMMTMSCKKDAIVNIGGFVAVRDADLLRKVSAFSVMNEGFLTYGGLAGRDMNAISVGLYEGTDFATLDTRIRQVEYLGKRLEEFGIPYQRPPGGHAIFVDANKFLPNIPREQFRAQTLGIELYIEGGIRGVEIGAVLADRDPITKENRYPALEMLRLALPRRVYTNNHMDVVAVALKNVFDRRDQITNGFEITWEAPILRHFTCEFERK